MRAPYSETPVNLLNVLTGEVAEGKGVSRRKGLKAEQRKRPTELKRRLHVREVNGQMCRQKEAHLIVLLGLEIPSWQFLFLMYNKLHMRCQ